MLMHLLLLMYTDIHCSDALGIIQRVVDNDRLSNAEKVELVQVIQEATPDCTWDAYD